MDQYTTRSGSSKKETPRSQHHFHSKGQRKAARHASPLALFVDCQHIRVNHRLNFVFGSTGGLNPGPSR